MKTGGFSGFKNQIFSKWFIKEDDPEIFNVTYGYGKKLKKLGEATQAENDLDKDVLEVKALVTKIGDLSKLTFKQKNVFLYGESNLIFHMFYTEFNKKLQIYSLISTSAIGIKTTQLVRPSNSLKFRIMNNKILTQLILSSEDTKEPGKIKTKDTKVTNFSILSTKRKTIIRLKRKMSYEIKDEFRIFGIQNFELFEKLNPVNIQIREREINSKLSKYSNKKYKYRFIITNLLLSSSTEQDTNVIFLICNGLNDAKESLNNGKLYKTLGVVNTAEIKDWYKLKGQSKWINIVFKDSENPTVAKHFAFVFETINFTDLLNFQLTLANGKAKLIKFKDGEAKVPVLSFTIQIMQ